MSLSPEMQLLKQGKAGKDVPPGGRTKQPPERRGGHWFVYKLVAYEECNFPLPMKTLNPSHKNMENIM